MSRIRVLMGKHVGCVNLMAEEDQSCRIIDDCAIENIEVHGGEARAKNSCIFIGVDSVERHHGR